jgi:hypothetical protein
MRSYFNSDNERIYDRQEARLYKDRAKQALTKRMIKQTSGWTDTYKRWRENRDKLDAYRAGHWKPEPQGFLPDWGKITYTALMQLLSVLVAAGCIFSGAWPVTLLTVPGFIALNLFFLIKDSGDYE